MSSRPCRFALRINVSSCLTSVYAEIGLATMQFLQSVANRRVDGIENWEAPVAHPVHIQPATFDSIDIATLKPLKQHGPALSCRRYLHRIVQMLEHSAAKGCS